MCDDQAHEKPDHHSDQHGTDDGRKDIPCLNHHPAGHAAGQGHDGSVGHVNVPQHDDNGGAAGHQGDVGNLLQHEKAIKTSHKVGTENKRK